MMHSLYMARGRIASYPKIYLAGSGRLRQATNGKFNYISCYQHQWQSTAPDSGIYRQYARAEKGKSNENTPNPRNKKNLQKAFRAGNRFQGRASSTSSWDNIHHDVSPYIRRCDSNPGGDPIYSRALQDSGFHIQFLGTGSGISDRMSSCTLVRLGEEGFLFDVGEGAQRHVKQSTAKVKKISRIFITHMHGDHVLGLPGLLLSSNLSNLFSEDSVLHVYGPPGVCVCFFMCIHILA